MIDIWSARAANLAPNLLPSCHTSAVEGILVADGPPREGDGRRIAAI
jgi:hypothetical protein